MMKEDVSSVVRKDILPTNAREVIQQGEDPFQIHDLHQEGEVTQDQDLGRDYSINNCYNKDNGSL